MNIAHLVPNSARFPLMKHNGRYEWMLRLAKLQADAGHDVTIYCGISTLTYPRITFRTISNPSESSAANNTALFELAFSHSAHDLFHSHFDELHYRLGSVTNKPIVVTQHWFPTEELANASKSYRHDNIYIVPVTRYMKKTNQKLGIICGEVIYHGIDLMLFKPGNPSEVSDRFLFVGRIAPHKGLLELVTMMVGAHLPLDIVGKINAKEAGYWELIKSYVDGDMIRYLGPKPQNEVAELMQTARAFVFTPQKEEAFGQTIIEAQACGTPVIINDLGANSELVDDGVSGYLVKNSSEFVTALEKITHIERKKCRSFAEGFDVHEMAQSYEKLYRDIIRS